MNKSEFIDQISQEHDLTKTEADRMLNIITSSITSALSQGNEIALIGFGKFYTSSIAAREGRNPKTGATLSIGAYKQVKFSAGQFLKNACNGKDSNNATKSKGASGKDSKSNNGKTTKDDSKDSKGTSSKKAFNPKT